MPGEDSEAAHNLSDFKEAKRGDGLVHAKATNAKKVRIVAVPSDAHGTLVKVGEFYFTTRPDDAIARGTIAMNLMQRRCAKVTTNGGDMVVLPPGGSTLPYAVVTDARIQVEYVAATKKGGTIDYLQFVDRIFAFDGQFFAQGQQMLVVLAGVKYVATITVLNSVAMGGGAAAQYAQFVRDKSKIFLAPLERCEIGLTNEPEDTTTATNTVRHFDPFGVHVEIGLPDEEGRLQILRIHTRGMSETHILDADVDFHYIAAHTKNFSGAEIEGLVLSAQSHALWRHIDFDRPTEVKDTSDIRIKFEDFKKALEEVKPALGRAEDECETVLDNGIINYGEDWENTDYRAKEFVRTLATSPKMRSLSILLTGAAGTGKSGLAAHMAKSSKSPHVKFISSNTMVGYGEVQKVNILRKAFDDAHKSTLSVIVLDDIERLVEYSGGRYLNVLLQTLMVLIKRPPPEGKKVLVIGTATNLGIMEALELVDCFSASMELQEVPAAALGRVVRGLGAEFADPADEPACIEALVQPVAMKRLIFLIEMACIDDPVTGKRKLNSTRFLGASKLR